MVHGDLKKIFLNCKTVCPTYLGFSSCLFFVFVIEEERSKSEGRSRRREDRGKRNREGRRVSEALPHPPGTPTPIMLRYGRDTDFTQKK